MSKLHCRIKAGSATSWGTSFMIQSLITWLHIILYLGPLPHLMHRMDSVHWMGSYSIILVVLIIQYVSPGLIYHIPFKCSSEYRINNFSLSSSMVFIIVVLEYSTNINEFICRTPKGGKVAIESLFYTWRTEALKARCFKVLWCLKIADRCLMGFSKHLGANS